MMAHTLLRKTFSQADQDTFIRLSGDHNPIHTDPVAARRSIVGRPVVHGLHLVLTVLEHVLTGDPQFRPARITARFVRPVYVGDVLELVEVGDGSVALRLEARVGDDTVLSAEIDRSEAPTALATEPFHVPLPPHERIVEATADEIDGRIGAVPIALDRNIANQMFPVCIAVLGACGVADLATITRIIGMHCPGLYSILSKLNVDFCDGTRRSDMHFRVEMLDRRFSRATIALRGATLSGRVYAFVRPAPHAQPSSAMLVSRVRRDEFCGSVALIVGGSRGVGEISAKLIALGGGHAIITYHSGRDDAQAVADDIVAAGGSCEIMHMDVLSPHACTQALFARRRGPRSIYYFATPHIFTPRRGFFSVDSFDNFCRYYLTSFSAILDIAARASPDTVRAFYPSTAAIDEDVRDIASYAMAKRAGEDLCAYYNRYADNIRITVTRLPRLRTDQTATLVEFPAVEPVDVMLPIIREVEGTTEGPIR